MNMQLFIHCNSRYILIWFYTQDLRIAKTPFHALNMRERETFKERSELLSIMGGLLRQTAVQREQENSDRQRQCTLSWGNITVMVSLCFWAACKLRCFLCVLHSCNREQQHRDSRSQVLQPTQLSTPSNRRTQVLMNAHINIRHLCIILCHIKPFDQLRILCESKRVNKLNLFSGIPWVNSAITAGALHLWSSPVVTAVTKSSSARGAAD